MADLDLIDLVPIDARGERGMTRIIRRENLTAWTEANAATLLEAGYVRVIVTDHVPTRAFGDRRMSRR
jgi:hypothetical protein